MLVDRTMATPDLGIRDILVCLEARSENYNVSGHQTI